MFSSLLPDPCAPAPRSDHPGRAGRAESGPAVSERGRGPYPGGISLQGGISPCGTAHQRLPARPMAAAGQGHVSEKTWRRE